MVLSLGDFIRYCETFDKDMPLDYYFLGLASEAGEVCDIRKKQIRDRKYNKQAMILELGDVMWYVMMLCDHLDISIIDVMEQNVKKLTERHSS